MEEFKKAIAILEAKKMKCEVDSELYNAIDLSIKSLEMQCKMYEHCEESCTDCPYKNPKQLKKRFMDGTKVHYAGDDESDGIECPMCGYEVARNDDYSEMRPKHCPDCGTKLIY